MNILLWVLRALYSFSRIFEEYSKDICPITLYCEDLIDVYKNKIDVYGTLLKNKIENNLNWEGAFYQTEWVKIISSSVILVFSLYMHCC